MVIKLVLLFERHFMFFSFGHGNTTYFTSITSVPLLPSCVQWVQIPCEGSFICPAWRWSCASCCKEEMKTTLPLIEPNIWQWKFSKPSQWTACFFLRILAVFIPTGTRNNSNRSVFYYSCDSSQRENIAKGTWRSLIMWVICLWPFLFVQSSMLSLNNREHG